MEQRDYLHVTVWMRNLGQEHGLVPGAGLRWAIRRRPNLPKVLTRRRG